MTKRIAIVGGGVFGLYISWFLAGRGHDVTVFEREKEPMTHASYHNQARVHNGYHYPRSVLTAIRSRISMPRFVADFGDCVFKDFKKVYCVGRPLGKVTGQQFYTFCKRIGAEIEPADRATASLMNPEHVEACFIAREYAFDALKLRDILLGRIADEKRVRILLSTEVTRVSETDGGRLSVEFTRDGDSSSEQFDDVFNCTYSRINFLTTKSALPVIPLKHEMTEMCLVEVPDVIKHMGITIMCGPFFSVMPFPGARINGVMPHSFSHVRYTPHYEWHDTDANGYKDAYRKLSEDERHSAWRLMVQDASRFIPLLSECRYEDSLWEVKTVLPRSETTELRKNVWHFFCFLRSQATCVRITSYESGHRAQYQNFRCSIRRGAEFVRRGRGAL